MRQERAPSSASNAPRETASVGGQPERFDVLLIEDNPGDVRLVKEALRESGIASNLHVASDGVEGLAFLRGQRPYEGAPRPDLLLLDLNLPRLGGLEVLREIRADETLRLLPVVVLSSSSAEPDVVGAYDLQANAYVSKPMDLDRFIRAVGSIAEFWLTVARLPGKGDER